MPTASLSNMRARRLHALFALGWVITAWALPAETVEVFRCVTESPPAQADTALISAGERLGKIDTGAMSLKAIIEASGEYSWEGEPFYGPAKDYVFKDAAGQLYVVAFEFLEGHEILGKGERFAIIRLEKAPRGSGKWVGSPYNGSNLKHEVILQQLRALARRKQ